MHDQDSSSALQTFTGHLMALRKMLVISFVAVVACFLLIFLSCSKELLQLIIQPIEDRNVQIIYTTVSEAFTTQFKVSFIAGVILAVPVIIWQIWCFISPALYPKERKNFQWFFWLAVFLFIAGVTFAYFVVYHMALTFFLVSGEGLAVPMLSIDEYVNFLFAFLLPFGCMFQLPVVIYLLAIMGKVNYHSLAKARKYVVLGIFTLSAILTPPDIISQTLLAFPMLFLYEVGAQIARFVKPRERC